MQINVEQTSNPIRAHWPLLAVILALAIFPFLVAIFDGQSVADVFASEAGKAKFMQGLLIEIFILAIYAISYDLIMGITGLLSFGHAMFFGVGAYLTGIMLKSFEGDLWSTLGLVAVAGVVQALLFSIVLSRVQGLTFALVTLGMAVVFHIVIRSRELGEYTGADVGLQGVITPAFISPANERFTFYIVALGLMFLVYLLYKRFVDSPTGRVCLAIRENESRAKMLGYNTFYFKVIALTISSLTAALAGMLHALFQPIVSPDVASLGFTISALLMVLFGGVGTLSGALIGAGIFKLLSYGLEKYFGENATVMIGLVYIAIVLFLPFGVVGTWNLRRAERRRNGDH